jgi:iron complex outermembrane recepter protein
MVGLMDRISMKRAVLLSSVGASLLVSTAAVAQTAPVATPAAKPAAEEAVEQIVVTGSRISRPDLEASSPVAVVTAEEVQLRQTNTAEQFLRELPSAVPSIGAQVNNGNGGASFVNLRGIGAGRNLVLIDGNRLSPAGLGGAFDLNNVPLSVIDNTQILTGGASTTYGADAIGGVVNFITKRDFAGIEATGSYQLTEKGDGETFRTDITIGANFDDNKGNAVFSVGYQNSDPVTQGDREFSINNVDSFTGVAGGSGTSIPVRLTGTRRIDPITGLPSVDPATGNNGTGQLNLATGLINSSAAGFTAFNFNPFNLLQTPFRRFNSFGSARYEISDAFEVYTQGLFSKNTVRTIIAPSGTFGTTFALPLSNPFLPAGVRNQLCAFDTNSSATIYTPRFTIAQCNAAALATSPTDPNYREVTVSAPRRFVEFGTRDSIFTTTYFNYGAGLRGAITSDLSYDVYASYGESANVARSIGQGLASRLRQSVRATNPNTCIDTSNSCVPINLFGPLGSITAANRQFIAGVSSSSETSTSLAQVRAVVNGSFDLGLGAKPLGFAVGSEYRDYRAANTSDLLTQTPGEILGSGAATPDISGKYDVKEVFAEINAPLIEDAAFAKSLSIEAGVRYSDYSSAGGNTTWKAGGVWEPVDGFKIRGNYVRGARAPNINELFAPLVTGLTTLTTDPCAGTAPVANAALRAVCLAQGAPASSIGSINNPSAAQANVTSGGNPNLGVEIAKTWTLGFVAQPEQIEGLSIKLDYFNIKVDKAISAPTPGDIIGACFGNLSPTSTACTSIRRNPLTGGLDGDATTTPGLPSANSNLGKITVNGFDLSFNYKRDVGFAELTLGFDGTYTKTSRFQATPTSVDRECIGFFSANCGSLQPKWAWTQRTALKFGGWATASVLWRHFSGFVQEPLDIDDNEGGGNGPAFGDFGFIKASDYFDLGGRFEVGEHVTLTVTMFNALNKKPKVVGSTIGSTGFNSGNVFPSTQDPLGRRFAVSAKIKF